MLAFRNRLENCDANGQDRSLNDQVTLCINLVNFGPDTLKITRLIV